MLQRSDIKRILTDLYRTELALLHPEASVSWQEPSESLWAKIPLDIKAQADAKVAALFGYPARSFSFFERMVDYCYASFLKNGQLVFSSRSLPGKAAEPRVLTTEMMWKESREIAALFPETKRIISLVPANNWYGFLFAAELPHILQVPLLHLADQPAQEWTTALQAGDLVVATPLFWKHWLRCGNQFASGVDVVTAAAPCSEELMSQLTAVGAASITDIYGSSSTGALGFRREGATSFTAFSFWNFSLSQGGLRLKHAGRAEWLTLPAQIEMSTERQFHPLSGQGTGRNTQETASASSIQHIEQVLSAHPAVRACRVRPISPLHDSRLEAVVALHEGYTPSHLGIIRTFLRQHLPSAEIPEAFTFEKPQFASALAGK